jgi:mono/diheme cytochrome c family protein
MRASLFAFVILSASATYAADESQVQLKDGPGRDLVRNNCATCHSLDYIQMNSPFLDRKGWEAETSKMINAYHAPIDKGNVAAIVDYLARYYGAPSSPASDSATPGGR